MGNKTLISAIHASINLRGRESTVDFNAKAGLRTRNTSAYQFNAYKMIFQRCINHAAIDPNI